jgi:hypothetical protein
MILFRFIFMPALYLIVAIVPVKPVKILLAVHRHGVDLSYVSNRLANCSMLLQANSFYCCFDFRIGNANPIVNPR